MNATIARASELKRQGLIGEAIDEFQKALVTAPGDFGGHLELAACFYEAKDFTQASSTLHEALKIQPDNPTALYLFGSSEYYLKRYESASETLKRAVELNPSDVWGYFFLGLSAYYREDFPLAITSLEKFNKLTPSGIDITQSILTASRGKISARWIVYTPPHHWRISDQDDGDGFDLALIKRALTDTFYDEDLYQKFIRDRRLPESERDKVLATPVLASELYGEIWPQRAETMIGLPRLNNLQYCIETVLRDRIDGDFIEAGVWRGGACIFMACLLKKHKELNRKIFVADSFEGLPPPDLEKYPQDKGDTAHTFDQLRVSVPSVQKNFTKYHVLGDNVVFIKGFFEDTLPVAPIDKLAILRLDGDMFSSTWQTMDALWKKLVPGGFILIDDYAGLPICREAVDAFRSLHNITTPVLYTDKLEDKYGVYWRKMVA
jgi:O-methyltransferase